MMTGGRILLAVLVTSFLFEGYYVNAWKACLLPTYTRKPNNAIKVDTSGMFECKNLDKNGMIDALTRNDFLLVEGAVSPDDLSPLRVEKLRKNMFLVRAPISPSATARKRVRRGVTHHPARHADLKDNDQNTFVVSTFAFNPKLLRNASHSQRYSVFARLTEGVLQEHYRKYGSKEPAHWKDINNQIYTEELFNNILDATGTLRDDKSGGEADEAHKRLQGKTFGQIVNEFQSRMLEEDEREPPTVVEGPQLNLWPKKNLHSDSEMALLANASGVLLVNDSHYLVNDDKVLQRIVSSNILFDKMQTRVMLLPSVTVEEGADPKAGKFPGFRMLALFTPRDNADEAQNDEKSGNASLIGAEALRQASLLLSGMNGQSESYPVT